MTQKKVPNAVKIKIHRNRAGQHIPYDTLYLFRREDRDLIPDIWGFALVLPFDASIVNEIKGLHPDTISHFQFKRNDDLENVPPKIPGIHKVPRKEHDAAKEEFWNALFEDHDLEDRVVVIPVLTSKLKNKLRPRYLGSERWFEKQLVQIQHRGRRGRDNRRGENLDPALSDLAYLATPYPAPNDKIRPICSICPRNLQHLQGECIPGMPICYKSLDFGDLGNQQEAAE